MVCKLGAVALSMRQRPAYVQKYGTDDSKWRLQTSTDPRVPRCDIWRDCPLRPPNAVASASSTRIRRVCNVSFVVEIEVTLVIAVFYHTKRQGEIVNVLDLLIFTGGDFL